MPLIKHFTFVSLKTTYFSVITFITIIEKLRTTKKLQKISFSVFRNISKTKKVKRTALVSLNLYQNYRKHHNTCITKMADPVYHVSTLRLILKFEGRIQNLEIKINKAVVYRRKN